MFELQRVGHRSHGVRIAAQDRHLFPDLALAVQLTREVIGRSLGRARPVREELNQHRPRPARATVASVALNGDQVNENLDDSEVVVHMGVRPARDLVQVRADARDSAGCARARPPAPAPSRSASAPSPGAAARTATHPPRRPWPASRRVRPHSRGRARWRDEAEQGDGAALGLLMGVRRGPQRPTRQPNVAHWVCWLTEKMP